MIFNNNYARTILLLAFCFFFVGCGDNPGAWPVEKVQTEIAQRLELTDVKLTAKEGGGFEGTGMLDGETVTLTITQDPDAGRISWNAVGDRGLTEDGFYELK